MHQGPLLLQWVHQLALSRLSILSFEEGPAVKALECLAPRMRRPADSERCRGEAPLSSQDAECATIQMVANPL